MATEEVKIIETIKRVVDLPTLPTIFAKISELIDKPKTSARDIGDIISDDQVLTAKLLKLVNSAFYGFPRKIATVTHAIVILGFTALKNLILTTSVFDLFSGIDSAIFNPEEFWRHAVGCAVGARIIARHMNYGEPEEIFVAGLLHDIGKIVQARFLTEDFAKALEAAYQRNILLLEAENTVLNYNHTLTGRLLAVKWKLPIGLVESIAFHHNVEKANEFPEKVAIVHLADILVRAQRLGSGGDRRVPRLDKDAWEMLHLKKSMIQPIMEEIEKEFEETVSILLPSGS